MVITFSGAFPKEIGKRMKREEFAKGLLKDGVPMEIIIRNTGLSEEEILKL